MSGEAICAICYEDARPTREDLQSISACGHVFHELWCPDYCYVGFRHVYLNHREVGRKMRSWKMQMSYFAPDLDPILSGSLQQWMEYCPAGRKPTCPLCKQSCSTRNVHRLYFQSAGADTTRAGGSPSRKAQKLDGDPKKVDITPTVRKLEGQLAVTKEALQAQNEKLKELDSQAIVMLQRAEIAEAANVDVRRELVYCKQSLTRTQEELKGCSIERAKLQEKNLAMSKDIAAHKLIGDADLGEEEIFRLANIGSGSNKNVVIKTLTKSLVLRNKSYKELMARCNELGMGESRALRKSEKTVEQLKKLKARVQELEKTLEEKENAVLRDLSRHAQKGRPEDNGSAQRPLACSNGLQGASFPTTPPLERLLRVSRSQVNAEEGSMPKHLHKRIDVDKDVPCNGISSYDRYVAARSELNESPLFKIVNEREQVAGLEHTRQASSDEVDSSEKLQQSHSRKRIAEDVSIEEQTASGVDIERTTENTEESGFSIWKVKAENLLLKIELLNQSRKENQFQDFNNHLVQAPKKVVQASSAQLGHRTRVLNTGSSVAASLFTCRDPPTPSSLIAHRRETSFSLATSSKPDIHGYNDHGLGSPMPATGAVPGSFVKHMPGGKPPSAPSGTFIISGADGRGGRVTILKPPSLPLGGIGATTSKKVKRLKGPGPGFGGRQGALRIEHFFGRAES